MAMRGIASHARRRPKALGSCRRGRVGEPPEGVGGPCRCAASTAAPLLPGGSPARSLGVNIMDLWYYTTTWDTTDVVKTRDDRACCRRPVKGRRRAGPFPLPRVGATAFTHLGGLLQVALRATPPCAWPIGTENRPAPPSNTLKEKRFSKCVNPVGVGVGGLWVVGSWVRVPMSVTTSKSTRARAFVWDLEN